MTQPCDIRRDGVTESCRAFGLTWSAEDAFPPVCPAPSPADRLSGGTRFLLLVMCAGLAVNAGLGILILWSLTQ